MIQHGLFRGLRGVAALTITITLGLLCLPVVTLFLMTDVTVLADDTQNLTLYSGSADTKNTYDFGYCTFWAAQRRAETGHPIPGYWGDAHDWDMSARRAGYRVDTIPQVGAILQSDMDPLGHVAYVEAVHPDGSITISEMNWKGWNIMDQRVLSSIQAYSATYIH